MSGCSDLDRYLDGRLAESRRLDFEAHVKGCATCDAQLRSWARSEEALQQWAGARELPRITRAGAQALMAKAGERRRNRTAPRWAWWAACAATTATAALLIVMLVRSGEPPSAVSDPVLAVAPRPPSPSERWVILAPCKRTRVLGQGRVKLRMSQGSDVRLRSPSGDRVELRLHWGAVALSVDPQRKGVPVVVVAGPHRVTVLGTRFGVSWTTDMGLQVSVDRGRLAVTGPKSSRQELTAGARLSQPPGAPPLLTTMTAAQQQQLRQRLGLAAPPPAQPQPPAMSPPGTQSPPARPSVTSPGALRAQAARGRALLYTGKYGEAVNVLRAYLGRAPRDGQAWSLLADGLRKLGTSNAAVTAYAQATRYGNAATANRARYLAAVLLQDRLGRPAGAIALLKAYLRQAGPHRPLSAEALVRQARAEARLGRTAIAKGLLQRVLRQYGGSTAAVRARKQLQKLGGALPRSRPSGSRDTVTP